MESLTKGDKTHRLKEILEENKGFFFDFEMFTVMKKALVETFSSGAIVIIATIAKPCGQRVCKQIVRKAKTREEALNEFAEQLNKQNWGELAFFDLDFERGCGKAVVENSFEARQYQSKTSCCHFFANFIAGFISELFNKNVIVKEARCVGRGDDHCEFRFKS